MTNGANGAGFGGNIGGSGGVNNVPQQNSANQAQQQQTQNNSILQALAGERSMSYYKKNVDLTGRDERVNDESFQKKKSSSELGEAERALIAKAISINPNFYELEPEDRFDVLVEAAGLNKDELSRIAMNAVNVGGKCCIALQNIANNPEAMQIVGKMDLNTLVKTLEGNIGSA